MIAQLLFVGNISSSRLKWILTLWRRTRKWQLPLCSRMADHKQYEFPNSDWTLAMTEVWEAILEEDMCTSQWKRRSGKELWRLGWNHIRWDMDFPTNPDKLWWYKNCDEFESWSTQFSGSDLRKYWDGASWVTEIDSRTLLVEQFFSEKYLMVMRSVVHSRGLKNRTYWNVEELQIISALGPHWKR